MHARRQPRQPLVYLLIAVFGVVLALLLLSRPTPAAARGECGEGGHVPQGTVTTTTRPQSTTTTQTTVVPTTQTTQTTLLGAELPDDGTPPDTPDTVVFQASGAEITASLAAASLALPGAMSANTVTTSLPTQAAPQLDPIEMPDLPGPGPRVLASELPQPQGIPVLAISMLIAALTFILLTLNLSRLREAFFYRPQH